jgi:hypothetical protein
MPFGVPWSNSPPGYFFHETRRRLRLVKGRQSEQIWAGTDCYLEEYRLRSCSMTRAIRTHRTGRLEVLVKASGSTVLLA